MNDGFMITPQTVSGIPLKEYGERFRLRLDLRGGQLTCSIDGVTTSFGSVPLDEGSIRLHQRRLSSVTDWIVAYRLGP